MSHLLSQALHILAFTMGKAKEWDFALKIRGVTPRSMPLARLAEYLKEFAALLGDEGKPVFAGIVAGSVVIRARETQQLPHALVRSRVRTARVDREAPGGRSYARLNDLMAGDGADGIVLDRDENTIVELPGRAVAAPPPQEYTMTDVGFIDGLVVGIAGVDDTVHIRVQEATGAVHSVDLRDLGRAREIAQHFRAEPVRIHVHGTWKRLAGGTWVPQAVHFDRFEVLDPAGAREVFDALAAIPGNGWAEVADPDALWTSMRTND